MPVRADTATTPRSGRPTPVPKAAGKGALRVARFSAARKSAVRQAAIRQAAARRALVRSDAARERAESVTNKVFNAFQDAMLPSSSTLAPYAGHWVAVRDGVVVAADPDGDRLIASERVQPTDLITWVPRPRA